MLNVIDHRTGRATVAFSREGGRTWFLSDGTAWTGNTDASLVLALVLILANICCLLCW